MILNASNYERRRFACFQDCGHVRAEVRADIFCNESAAIFRAEGDVKKNICEGLWHRCCRRFLGRPFRAQWVFDPPTQGDAATAFGLLLALGFHPTPPWGSRDTGQLNPAFVLRQLSLQRRRAIEPGLRTTPLGDAEALGT